MTDAALAHRLTAVIPRSAALLIFYTLGVILVGGGFVLYTAGSDLRLAREAGAGSPLSQLLLGSFYLVSALLLAANRDTRQTLRYAWPILLLPGLALASAFWSPDPQLTLRRATAFAGTIIFGLSLGAAFRFRDVMSLLAFAMALVMVLSLVAVFADPTRAIHQPDDLIQAVHAGHWRGLFAHRNTLGFWAAAALVTVGLAGREACWPNWLWASAMAGAAACLVASGSSAGLAIVALAATFAAVLTVTLNQPANLRGAVMVFWLLIGMAVILASGEIARIGLQILGRESNLSGRTELWSYLLDLIRAADKPLGLGYFVGTVMLDQRLSSAMQMRNVNAHNGFLEAYVYFGWPGTILAAGVAAWLFYETLRLAVKSSERLGGYGAVPAVLVFMCLVHNLVESTLVSPNNLNNVLLSAMAAVVARARLVERG